MLAVDYESRVSEWQVRSLPRNILRRSMHDRAQEIAEQLKQAGVGKRPIIWVEKFKHKKFFNIVFFSDCTFYGRFINKIYLNK